MYEPTADTCPVCAAQKANAGNVEAKLLELLRRQVDDPGAAEKRRAVVREALAPLAVFAPAEAMAQVEQRIADRL